ncbi:hypothetical protein CN987_12260 [Bacillus thuringiensis]|nr:hypothetical protein CN987_12260 [Bacillus thuringiensis]
MHLILGLLISPFWRLYPYKWLNFDLKILGRICDSLKKHGVIHCLRYGIKDLGVALKLVYNKPPTTMNQLMIELYQKNIFTVSSQVYYSGKHNNSLDMVVFINGLPLVVMGLKNQFTGQTVEHAMNQFKKERDPKGQLFTFNEHVTVYFTVDPDEVFVATELKKSKTYFLSFNKGNNGGKGNPTIYDNSRTHYLWEEVLRLDSLLDILFRFAFVKKDDILDSYLLQTKTPAGYPARAQTSIIFYIYQGYSGSI